MNKSKIDLRMVENVPMSGCPYMESNTVACFNHRTPNDTDGPFQYICVCDGQSQLRGEYNE